MSQFFCTYIGAKNDHSSHIPIDKKHPSKRKSVGGGVVYHPHNGGGVIHFFDDDGNEWMDAPESIKKLYEDMYL